MRNLLSLLAIALPGTAFADPGHIGGLGGHDHWIAGIALAGAAGAAIWGLLKGKGNAEPSDSGEADTDNGEAQEA